MFNKRANAPLTRIASLVFFIILAVSLAACGSDSSDETGRKYAPIQNAESASSVESPDLAAADVSLRFVRAAQPNALEIWVDNARNLYAADIEIHFDPTKAQLADANAEQDGVQLQAGQTPAPDFIATNSGDNQTGVARYVVTQVAPREGFNGSGLLATLLWEEEVDPAAVSFGQVTLVDQDGQAIQTSLQNAGQDAVSMN